MTGSSDPLVSVIIPTYNRKESLLVTLASLAEQTYPADCFEVIVVDDGGDDDTVEVAHFPYPFRLVYLRQTNQGSAAARNYGAQQSCGGILVFIDDDMTAHPGYLLAIAGKVTPTTIGMGLLQPQMPRNRTHFAAAMAREIEAVAAQALSDEEVLFTECTSNNLAVHRAAFIRVGMWRDVLGDGPTLWGDVEFGYRAWKKGSRFVRAADAKIVHRDRHALDLAAATQRAYHAAKIVQPLFALHPGIQQYLPMFRDKGPIVAGQDSPALILRKLRRQAVSSWPAMWAMERAVPVLERHTPGPTVLRLLYRWIISGYTHRGYREGLREAAVSGGGRQVNGDMGNATEGEEGSHEG